MKTILIALALVSSSVMADNLHQGYIRKDGAYVAPHFQTAPDATRKNNYSARGNRNPYTWKAGTRDTYKQPSPIKPQRGKW